MITLHSPALGIVTILFLVVAYFMTIRTMRYDVIDVIGYTLMFACGIAGVFIGGVLPFM
ncbi:hypothetical protein V7111_07250 [Neobacillus niacini]|uniref:hypothetical protein n=1 Tax=Neobacillus niacini TaxID=86668 RepID=UPI002FFF5A38